MISCANLAKYEVLNKIIDGGHVKFLMNENHELSLELGGQNHVSSLEKRV